MAKVNIKQFKNNTPYQSEHLRLIIRETFLWLGKQTEVVLLRSIGSEEKLYPSSANIGTGFDKKLPPDFSHTDLRFEFYTNRTDWVNGRTKRQNDINMKIGLPRPGRYTHTRNGNTTLGTPAPVHAVARQIIALYLISRGFRNRNINGWSNIEIPFLDNIFVILKPEGPKPKKKTKPSITEQRYEKVQAQLKRWQRKKKQATTKVKYYQKRVDYYIKKLCLDEN